MSDCLMCDVLCKERDEHWDARIDAEAARDLLKAALVECKAKLKKRDADYCEALLDAERFDAWMSEREVAQAEADLALQRARAEAQLARATRLEGENANLRANLDVAVEEKRKAEARVRDCFPCERWETPE